MWNQSLQEWGLPGTHKTYSVVYITSDSLTGELLTLQGGNSRKSCSKCQSCLKFWKKLASFFKPACQISTLCQCAVARSLVNFFVALSLWLYKALWCRQGNLFHRSEWKWSDYKTKKKHYKTQRKAGGRRWHLLFKCEFFSRSFSDPFCSSHSFKFKHISGSLICSPLAHYN